MIVVSDASPLTNLAAIGRLELLRDLYQRVLVPVSVADELRAGDVSGAHGTPILSTAWIEVREVVDHKAVEALLADLDLGEAEAIVLAKEVHAELLLMDERAGRSIAMRQGIRTVGLLSALVLAKRRGLLPAGKPVLDGLIHDAGFWVSEPLYQEVLRELDER